MPRTFLLKKPVILSMVCLVILVFRHAAATEVLPANTVPDFSIIEADRSREPLKVDADRTREMAKILATLENRLTDRKIIDKVEEKLAGMTPGDLKLMGSLCDRIQANRSTVAADLAYSLVTAMIILS